MDLELKPIARAELSKARLTHFARLREAPELFLELQVPSAAARLLEWKGRPAGYCLTASDGTLIELELTPGVWPVKEVLFAALCDALEPPMALCFSFDSLLVTLCAGRGWCPAIEGHLFRELSDEEGPSVSCGLEPRVARADDADWIVPNREGVFEHDEEVHEFVGKGCVHAFTRHGVPVGIGLTSPVWDGGPERDVGVMVLPEHRGQGIASQILRWLKSRCLGLGLRPTAGCAAGNVASRRALERAGFVAQHSLLGFSRDR